ncbi:MAG: hypothetical protein ACJAWV_004127 [Flammeovirgaceae bacterium]|jgi:hypothetical protein
MLTKTSYLKLKKIRPNYKAQASFYLKSSKEHFRKAKTMFHLFGKYIYNCKVCVLCKQTTKSQVIEL